MGQKKFPGKFPPNFPQIFPNFPAKNQKKIHRRASAGAQGEKIRELRGLRRCGGAAFKKSLILASAHQLAGHCVLVFKVLGKAG